MCLGALLQATSPLALRGRNFIVQLSFAASLLSDQFYLQVQVDIFQFLFLFFNFLLLVIYSEKWLTVYLVYLILYIFRGMKTTTVLSADGVKDDWWFKKMLSSRSPMDTPSQTQSSLLSELDSVYELQSMYSWCYSTSIGYSTSFLHMLWVSLCYELSIIRSTSLQNTHDLGIA